MGLLLGSLAGLICVLYSIYFFKIIKGDPQGFEVEMIKALAEWIIFKGAVSKSYIWIMYYISLAGEVFYFWLTLRLIDNPFMISFTILFCAFESLHMSRMAIIFKRFFTGRALLSQIFNWRVERASALLFFTHSILILVVLLFL